MNISDFAGLSHEAVDGQMSWIGVRQMRGFRAMTIPYQKTLTLPMPNYRCLAPHLSSASVFRAGPVE
jgi:hypothetical protein